MRRFMILTVLLFSATSQSRANYVVNNDFSSGSTLPFTLAVDPGATAGTLAADGGLRVQPYSLLTSGNPVVNAAVFNAGSVSGSSSTPIGALLTQVVTIPASGQYEFSADFTGYSLPNLARVQFVIDIGGSIIVADDYTSFARYDHIVYDFNLDAGSGTTSFDIGAGFRVAGDPSKVTEYLANISLVMVPEPASGLLATLGMAVGLGVPWARRRRPERARSHNVRRSP